MGVLGLQGTATVAGLHRANGCRQCGEPDGAPSTEIALVRDDALSALAYAANWRMILRGTDYFAQTAAPSPLQHTWSLAIEEQFYLLWPLVLLLLLGCRPIRRLGLVAVPVTAVLGAVVSVTVGWLLTGSGRDLNRVYFGTDTRAVSILVGVGLAGILATRRGTPRRVVSQYHRSLGVAAAVATAVLLWLFSHAAGSDAQLYHGQLLLAALAVAAVLAHAVLVPQSLTARVLSLPHCPPWASSPTASTCGTGRWWDGWTASAPDCTGQAWCCCAAWPPWPPRHCRTCWLSDQSGPAADGYCVSPGMPSPPLRLCCAPPAVR
ncbi:MAG: acyltransferase [Pseudonocardiales bacterium]|nr:acyltransferase [Pseudonocardiales bacterium]